MPFQELNHALAGAIVTGMSEGEDEASRTRTLPFHTTAVNGDWENRRGCGMSMTFDSSRGSQSFHPLKPARSNRPNKSGNSFKFAAVKNGRRTQCSLA